MWRTEAQDRLSYSGAAYEDPQTKWARGCYSVALIWLWDERLFDVDRQAFSVDNFLDETADHGGFDAVVLWHAYPIIGIDDRNQFDYYRAVPGIVELVAEFRARGIRVFIDYNPWDTGTRRAEHDDADELAAIVHELTVDGVFLDTMKEGDEKMVRALLSANPPQTLEGESRLPNQRIEDHQLSWAQWFADSNAPGVMRARWYERRHMVHSTRRWNRDHSDELQSSWMNGAGMLVWDTVFGVWVGWNSRDKSTLRRMVRVQRALNAVFSEGDWAPLEGATENALGAGVYVSRFSLGALTLWTLVNRSLTDYRGQAILGLDEVLDSQDAGVPRAYDVTAGLSLGSDAVITVPARGVAGVLLLNEDGPVNELPEWLVELLGAASADAHAVEAEPVDPGFPVRLAERRAAPHRIRAASSEDRGEKPAIVVPAGRTELTIAYRRRETGSYSGAPYVEEWKPLPPRLHDARTERLTVNVGGAEIATREVTQAEFAEFVRTCGYVPAVRNRFLSSWQGGEPADPEAPATELGLDDAREYAEWAGARLPTEHEWQLAASEPGFERLRPAVWNWTESEHSDGITRFVMLKGGSDYAAAGSDWYTDGGMREPQFSLKYLIPGLGMDRSPSIGFRIAWDSEGARDERGNE